MQGTEHSFEPDSRAAGDDVGRVSTVALQFHGDRYTAPEGSQQIGAKIHPSKKAIVETTLSELAGSESPGRSITTESRSTCCRNIAKAQPASKHEDYYSSSSIDKHSSSSGSTTASELCGHSNPASMGLLSSMDSTTSSCTYDSGGNGILLSASTIGTLEPVDSSTGETIGNSSSGPTRHTSSCLSNLAHAAEINSSSSSNGSISSTSTVSTTKSYNFCLGCGHPTDALLSKRSVCSGRSSRERHFSPESQTSIPDDRTAHPIESKKPGPGRFPLDLSRAIDEQEKIFHSDEVEPTSDINNDSDDTQLDTPIGLRRKLRRERELTTGLRRGLRKLQHEMKEKDKLKERADVDSFKFEQMLRTACANEAAKSTKAVAENVKLREKAMSLEQQLLDFKSTVDKRTALEISSQLHLEKMHKYMQALQRRVDLANHELHEERTAARSARHNLRELHSEVDRLRRELLTARAGVFSQVLDVLLSSQAPSSPSPQEFLLMVSQGAEGETVASDETPSNAFTRRDASSCIVDESSSTAGRSTDKHSDADTQTQNSTYLGANHEDGQDDRRRSSTLPRSNPKDSPFPWTRSQRNGEEVKTGTPSGSAGTKTHPRLARDDTMAQQKKDEASSSRKAPNTRKMAEQRHLSDYGESNKLPDKMMVPGGDRLRRLQEIDGDTEMVLDRTTHPGGENVHSDNSELNGKGAAVEAQKEGVDMSFEDDNGGDRERVSAQKKRTHLYSHLQQAYNSTTAPEASSISPVSESPSEHIKLKKGTEGGFPEGPSPAAKSMLPSVRRAPFSAGEPPSPPSRPLPSCPVRGHQQAVEPGPSFAVPRCASALPRSMPELGTLLNSPVSQTPCFRSHPYGTDPAFLGPQLPDQGNTTASYNFPAEKFDTTSSSFIAAAIPQALILSPPRGLQSRTGTDFFVLSGPITDSLDPPLSSTVPTFERPGSLTSWSQAVTDLSPSASPANSSASKQSPTSRPAAPSQVSRSSASQPRHQGLELNGDGSCLDERRRPPNPQRGHHYERDVEAVYVHELGCLTKDVRRKMRNVVDNIRWRLTHRCHCETCVL